MRELIEKVIQEMPWVEVSDEVVDLRLEGVTSKEQALALLKDKLSGMSKEACTEVVDDLFSTYIYVMRKLDISREEVEEILWR